MDAIAREEETMERNIGNLQKKITAMKADNVQLNAKKKSLEDGKAKLDAEVREIVSQFYETNDLGDLIKGLLETRKSSENEIR